jgi:hypothetical protein
MSKFQSECCPKSSGTMNNFLSRVGLFGLLVIVLHPLPSSWGLWGLFAAGAVFTHAHRSYVSGI